MRRWKADAILISVSIAAGSFFGTVHECGVFSSIYFQVPFGVTAGVLLALILGGGAIEVLERRHRDRLKKRIVITTDKDRTTLVIEPKEGS